MAEQIIEQMGQTVQRGSGQTGVQPGQGRDPLGRRWGNGNREAIEGVQIPDQMDQAFLVVALDSVVRCVEIRHQNAREVLQ